MNGGLNVYLYAAANPLRLVDPYGLKEVERLRYELEIMAPYVTVRGSFGLTKKQNYRIWVLVDEACESRLLWTRSGWLGDAQGRPDIGFGDDVAGLAGDIEFSRDRYFATMYEFYSDSCQCDVKFSRDEVNDYKIYNWISGWMKAFSK